MNALEEMDGIDLAKSRTGDCPIEDRSLTVWGEALVEHNPDYVIYARSLQEAGIDAAVVTVIKVARDHDHHHVSL